MESEKIPGLPIQRVPTQVREYLFNSRVLICFHLTLALKAHLVFSCFVLFCFVFLLSIVLYISINKVYVC